jgi:hypothetical protein
MIFPHFHRTGTPTLLACIHSIPAVTSGIDMRTQRRMSRAIGEEKIDFLEGEVCCFGVEEVDNL